MKRLLFLLLIIIPGLAIGQASLEYMKVNEIRPRTGATIQFTAPIGASEVVVRDTPIVTLIQNYSVTNLRDSLFDWSPTLRTLLPHPTRIPGAFYNHADNPTNTLHNMKYDGNLYSTTSNVTVLNAGSAVISGINIGLDGEYQRSTIFTDQLGYLFDKEIRLGDPFSNDSNLCTVGHAKVLVSRSEGGAYIADSGAIKEALRDTVLLTDLTYTKDQLYTKSEIDTMTDAAEWDNIIGKPDNITTFNYHRQYFNINCRLQDSTKLISKHSGYGIIPNSIKILINRLTYQGPGTKKPTITIGTTRGIKWVNKQTLRGTVDTIYNFNCPSQILSISTDSLYLKIDTTSNFLQFYITAILDYDKIQLTNYGTAYLPESDSVFAHMTGLTDEWKVAIDSCIRLLQDSAIWQEADVLSFINLNNSTNILNWKNRTAFTRYGSPTFVAKTGWYGTTANANNYLSTNYTPSLNAEKFTLSNACIAVGIQANGTGGYFGVTNNAAYFYSTSTYVQKFIHGQGFQTNTFLNPVGLLSISRISGQDTVWYNGVAYDFGTKTANGLSNSDLRILAHTGSYGCNATVDFVYAGAHLSGLKQRRLKNIRTWFNTKISGL